MSRALEGLYRSLEPLRLYALRQDSFIDRELLSYEEGLRETEALFGEILAGAFVQTAAGELLARHEALVGVPPRPGLSDEIRRELVLRRMGAAFDSTGEGLIQSIAALGLEASITEHPAEEALTVKIERVVDETLDFDRLKELVFGVLPAHLDCALDYGEVTWDGLEERIPDWDGWDGAGFSWAQVDWGDHPLFREYNTTD